MSGSFVSEYGSAVSSATGMLGSAWHNAVEPAASGIMDAVRHPAGNPWFQAAVGLGIAVVTWKFASMGAQSSSSWLGKLAWGGGGFAAVLALGLAGAAGIGMLRQDGPASDRPAVLATDDTRLQAPFLPGNNTG